MPCIPCASCCVGKAGSSGGSGAGGEAALGSEAQSIEDQLRSRGGQFDVEAITMQYPVVYEESMNTVRCQGCFINRPLA